MKNQERSFLGKFLKPTKVNNETLSMSLTCGVSFMWSRIRFSGSPVTAARQRRRALKSPKSNVSCRPWAGSPDGQQSWQISGRGAFLITRVRKSRAFHEFQSISLGKIANLRWSWLLDRRICHDHEALEISSSLMKIRSASPIYLAQGRLHLMIKTLWIRIPLGAEYCLSLYTYREFFPPPKLTQVALLGFFLPPNAAPGNYTHPWLTF